jgi:ribosomal protein S18 acetylase RimI-like enzyme
MAQKVKNQASDKQISFVFCDFSELEHVNAMLEMLNHYMEDPMGDHLPHDRKKQEKLIRDLAAHPTVEILLAKVDGKYAGMVTTFVNYSTFKLQPYLYIHDVVVHESNRGQGIGRKMLQFLHTEAKSRGYCKVTLEVREDNPAALKLYASLGYKDCEPKMYFWTKYL